MIDSAAPMSRSLAPLRHRSVAGRKAVDFVVKVLAWVAAWAGIAVIVVHLFGNVAPVAEIDVATFFTHPRPGRAERRRARDRPAMDHPFAELIDLRSQLAWHLIGPLQSNKTRVVAEAFDWVHGIDRLKIAQRLSQQRPSHRAPLNVCLQVNISGQASKSGFAPEDVPAAARAVALLPRGLVGLPEAIRTRLRARKEAP